MKFATVETPSTKTKKRTNSSEIVLILSIQEARTLQTSVIHAVVETKDKLKGPAYKRLAREIDEIPIW